MIQHVLNKDDGEYGLTARQKINAVIDIVNDLDSNFVKIGTIQHHVKDYGAKGDGVTDDTAAINSAATAARLAGGSLLFDRKKYLTTAPLIFDNLHVKANDAIILATNTNSPAEPTAIKVSGSITSYYSLIADCFKSESVVKVSPADLATLALEKGDLIKIISSSLFAPTAGEGVFQGEIQKVYSVDAATGEIKLYNYLEDTYLIINNARIAKVTASGFVTEGALNIYQDGSSFSTGMEIQYTENVRFKVNIVNAFNIGLNLGNSYAADVEVSVYGSEKSGTGYGVIISNCTMYSRITGMAQSSRHCITGGGDSSALPRAHGVSWGNIVYNFIGSDKFSSTVFDTHASCGSLTFDNCTAINGTTHTGVLVQATAFKCESRNISIKNSEAKGPFVSFFTCTSVDAKNITIQNSSYNGAASGIVISSTTATESLYINGFYGKCDSYNTTGSLVFVSGIHQNFTLLNLTGHNTGGIYVGIGATLPPLTSISNVNITFTSSQTTLTASLMYVRSTMSILRLVNCNLRNGANHLRSTEAISIYESIGNSAIGNNGTISQIDKFVSNLSVVGGYYTATVGNGYLIYLPLGCGKISLTGGIVTVSGTTLRGIYVLTTFTSLANIGNDLNFVTSNPLWTASLVPANQVNISAGNVLMLGTVTAPTSAVTTNTTQVATTAFVQSAKGYQSYVSKTAAYTVLITDYVINCSGTFTVTLLTAAGNIGKVFIIKNSGTGVITVDTTGSQTIDSGLTKVLSVQYSSVTVQSNGANWIIIATT